MLAGRTNKAVSLESARGGNVHRLSAAQWSGALRCDLSACHAAGFSPRVGQEAPRIVSTLNLVAAGLGISLVPESLQSMRMDGVVFRRIGGAAQPTAPLYLASRRGETSAAARKFLELVKRSRPNADTVST